MSWRDLPGLPDEMYELEKPGVSEGGGPGELGGHITLHFSDPLARQWWAEYLKSKRAYGAFGDWVDERRLAWTGKTARSR